MKKIIITIDGPAGSGKGRIAKYIAKKYNFIHIDSGLLYRKTAKLLIDNKINLKKLKQIKQTLMKNNKFSLRNNNNLRNEQIGKISSIIAKINIVRIHINKQQIFHTKQKTKKKGFVIDGRDIGSVVFKRASLKLYVDVDVNIRAKRRYKQLIDNGEKSIYLKILKDIKLRDKTDKTRKNSPLVVPRGAKIINNSHTFKKTIAQIRNIIEGII